MTENNRVKPRSEVKLLSIIIDVSYYSLHILKTYAAQQVTVCKL